MLLPSERHSAADLEHWRRCERVDRLNGQRLVRSGRGERAIEIIRAFVDGGRCYVSTSWGKDSVVALHLVAQSGVRAPVVHIVQAGPHLDPYQSAVRDAFRARFDLDYHEIIVEPQEREQRDDGRAPALEVGIRRASRLFGPRWIGGLRADESGMRKMRAAMGSRTSCWPIKRWRSSDVYAWLAVHELPVHPAYAMTQGGLWDRDRLRVSIIGGAKGRGHGRRQWEWHYYPDVMRELLRLGLVEPPSTTLLPG